MISCILTYISIYVDPDCLIISIPFKKDYKHPQHACTHPYTHPHPQLFTLFPS